jgi:hypothetical protein
VKPVVGATGSPNRAESRSEIRRSGPPFSPDAKWPVLRRAAAQGRGSSPRWR